MLSDQAAELNRDGFFMTTGTGTSMLPLIRGGRDAVYIKKKERPVKIGDVVFYKRDSGVYVLHRVVSIKKDGYTLCGDNDSFFEKCIRDEQVLGIMTGYFRDACYIDCQKLSYRLYARLWRKVNLLRRIIARLKRGF